MTRDWPRVCLALASAALFATVPALAVLSADSGDDHVPVDQVPAFAEAGAPRDMIQRIRGRLDAIDRALESLAEGPHADR